MTFVNQPSFKTPKLHLSVGIHKLDSHENCRFRVSYIQFFLHDARFEAYYTLTRQLSCAGSQDPCCTISHCCGEAFYWNRESVQIKAYYIFWQAKQATGCHLVSWHLKKLKCSNNEIVACQTSLVNWIFITICNNDSQICPLHLWFRESLFPLVISGGLMG